MTDRIEKIREKAERTYLRGNSAKTDAQQFAYETAVRWAGIALTYTDEDVERAARAMHEAEQQRYWSDNPVPWEKEADQESCRNDAVAVFESFGARRAE